ncbi:apolipoprotein C-IV [Pungitius pungitius]|uniref:apolipoprotein C-IV n=1 Tax=Pungitius pungitius TaxID=134920 RepID=UPI002E13B4AE
MHLKGLVLGLVLLLQACGALSDQPPMSGLPEAEPPADPPGLLQRLAQKTREVNAKVQDLGGPVMDFIGAYYEDHIQPVTESYVEWASNLRSSMLDKIQITIGNYLPL